MRRERPYLRSRRRREELDDVAGGGEEEAAVVRVADGGEQAARGGGGAGHRVRVCSRTVAISASRHAATCSRRGALTSAVFCGSGERCVSVGKRLSFVEGKYDMLHDARSRSIAAWTSRALRRPLSVAVARVYSCREEESLFCLLK